MPSQVKYTKSGNNYSTNSHYNTRGPEPNKSLYMYIFKISLGFLFFTFYIICFNTIKNSCCEQRAPFDFIISSFIRYLY